MTPQRQIFQADSRRRWRIFQWTNRFIILLLLAALAIAAISVYRDHPPALPDLNTAHTHVRMQRQVPLTMNAGESQAFHGFSDVLKSPAMLVPSAAGFIRSAFYVDWDPQSFYSLQRNISKLNMVLPEWFFINPGTNSITMNIDTAALSLMRLHHVAIVPILNNINLKKGEGEFDGSIIHQVLSDPARSNALIESIVSALTRYRLQGINIDFEELQEGSEEGLIRFQKLLYERLHPLGLLVTQDVMPSNDDYNPGALARYNDYIFLMAYDEYYASSVPGSVSAQQWIEKTFREFTKDIPENKVVLCMAGYGYDWAPDEEAETVTYQQAMALARQYKASIHFDNNTYNCYFEYTDGDSAQHEVYFADAATNFNTIRFASTAGAAGTALWRLGSEDERLWRFYNKDLSNESLAQQPFDFTLLTSSAKMVDQPDYIGEGEVLNVISEPQAGSLKIEVDTSEQTVSEEQYLAYPTNYVIRKFGKVNNQVILTFDDGPDPEYTPRILDILKKEKVPATFFVVGMNAEANLPLLKRIYAEGHEIGNHTFTHPNMATVSDRRAYMEMETTRKLIESTIGRSTILFRAPYNADAEPTKQVELKPVAMSRERNYYTVGESIDPNDWDEGVTAQQVYQRVVHQYEQNPAKGIILLHDAGGDREATVQALPAIIRYFKTHRVQFTTVSDLLHKPKTSIMPVVNDNLIAVDQRVASFGYVAEKFMDFAFWVAIGLGLIRILVFGIMAFIRRRQERLAMAAPLSNDLLPLVTIVVPGYNEELNAVKTVESLLRQDYPALQVLFVDDGSTDQTFEKVSLAFKGNSKVEVVRKPNGGKASALNYGIKMAQADFLVCIDADTQLLPDAVRRLMEKMISAPCVGAVAGTVRVGNNVNLLTRWQRIEYIIAQNFDRRALDLVNGISVVPGAIGAFSKAAVQEAGGFTTDTLAEDCDLTIRILRAGYRVFNCAEAVAVTEAPETLSQFMKQRFRWCYGIMQSFWKNRDACFRPAFGGLGLVSLPNLLIFQVLLPILAPLADLMLVFSLFWNQGSGAANLHMALFYGSFLIVDLLVSITAFRYEKQALRDVWWIIPQRFVYRQLMYVVLYRSIRKAIKGEGQGWGVLNRTGRAQLTT